MIDDQIQSFSLENLRKCNMFMKLSKITIIKNLIKKLKKNYEVTG